MKYFLLALIFIFCRNENYAILFSGIGPWSLYAYHAEAGVMQAYYQLIRSGFKEENIITLLMNTSTFSEHNPWPGEIYEHTGGPNVYPGFKDHMDYTMYDNTPENFLKILSGEDMTGIGTGRTLKSTSEDNVFIFTIQHGDVGYLSFYYKSETDRKTIYAADMISTIKKMKSKKMFKKLFWNQESCYSGSLWNKEFENDDSVIFITGATPERSALICDFSQELGTYMSGCLVKSLLKMWREQDSSTMQDYFNYAYKNKKYQPFEIEEYCHYGNMDLSKTDLSEFVGTYQPKDEDKYLQRRDLRVIKNSAKKMRPSKQKTQDMNHMYPVINNNNNNYRITQENENFYDIDYPLCYFYPKMNQTCIKIIVSEFFKTTTDQTCLWAAFDYFRMECSKENQPNPYAVLEDLQEACKLHPPPPSMY